MYIASYDMALLIEIYTNAMVMCVTIPTEVLLIFMCISSTGEYIHTW